jgi:hypothetical protein
MLDRSDWDVYAGPSEFFAATGDRILRREIPEQEEEFWADFLVGQNGKGFEKIDCHENRELLLQKYAAAYGSNAPVVRSQLNSFWRKFAISYGVFEAGFINPNAVEEEVDDRPRDAQGRILSQKQIQWQQWANWCNDIETPTKAILEKRRLDPAFREFYEYHTAAERTPVGDGVENLNGRQQAPSTATSKRVASDEVQRFAQDYLRLPTAEIKKMLSPGMNPQGPEAARHAKQLFDQAVLFGLL